MLIKQTMPTITLIAIVCGSPFNATPLSGSPRAHTGPATEYHVAISHDNTETSLCVWGGTVGDALAAAGIAADEDDIITPDPSTQVTGDTSVLVVRVTTRRLTEETVVVAPKTVIPSSELRPGRALVLERGQDGKVRREYEVTCYDGVEHSRKLLTETVTKPARPHVIAQSAKTLASRHGRGRRTMQMTATAYSAQQRGIKNSTAIGLRTGRGAVAVDPKVIPLGTRLYIEGYGFAIAGDTGRSIKGRRVDLGFETVRDARRFGRQKVTVHILD